MADIPIAAIDRPNSMLRGHAPMHIRYGYTMDLVCEDRTPIITMLDIHPSRRVDITEIDDMTGLSLTDAEVTPAGRLYLDGYGNICRRLVVPPGGIRLSSMGIIHDSGFADERRPDARQMAPEALPFETLGFLLGSRYCETELLSNWAWTRFQSSQPGWERVVAICDFVHSHMRFDASATAPTRTALQAFEQRAGVCRDFAHLAVTLCRCMNIPARYCTGYLGDIGVDPNGSPMDFSAWFEAFLDGRWWTFDARHNRPRIGRILIAFGRDAADVPIVHAFGVHRIERFEVITEEIVEDRFPVTSKDRRDHWGRLKPQHVLEKAQRRSELDPLSDRPDRAVGRARPPAQARDMTTAPAASRETKRNEVDEQDKDYWVGE